MPGQHHPSMPSATQARGRGISPPEITKGGFFMLFWTKSSVILGTFQRTRGGSPQTNTISKTGVSWGHTCQMCSYPAACGVPSPICSCPCSESYLLIIIHFPASRAARVQKRGQGCTYQMDPWPGDDSEGNTMSTKPRVTLQQGP